jgi:hypothetical protein
MRGDTSVDDQHKARKEDIDHVFMGEDGMQKTENAKKGAKAKKTEGYCCWGELMM